MKDLNNLQSSIAKENKTALESLDKSIVLLEEQLNDLELTFLQRKIITADISRLKHIKWSIRSLEIVDTL